MGIVSLTTLLKSSTVLWFLGIPSSPLKDIRSTSPQEICRSGYNYGYTKCDDLAGFVTPPIPGEFPEGQSPTPDFIGKHPFVYKILYGNSIETVDVERLALAEKLYEELDCGKYFQGYEKGYESLQEDALIKFLNTQGMNRIGREKLDREMDYKRTKCPRSDGKKRHLRRSAKKR